MALRVTVELCIWTWRRVLSSGEIPTDLSQWFKRNWNLWGGLNQRSPCHIKPVYNTMHTFKYMKSSERDLNFTEQHALISRRKLFIAPNFYYFTSNSSESFDILYDRLCYERPAAIRILVPVCFSTYNQKSDQTLNWLTKCTALLWSCLSSGTHCHVTVPCPQKSTTVHQPVPAQSNSLPTTLLLQYAFRT